MGSSRIVVNLQRYRGPRRLGNYLTVPLFPRAGSRFPSISTERKRRSRHSASCPTSQRQSSSMSTCVFDGQQSAGEVGRRRHTFSGAGTRQSSATSKSPASLIRGSASAGSSQSLWSNSSAPGAATPKTYEFTSRRSCHACGEDFTRTNENRAWCAPGPTSGVVRRTASAFHRYP